MKRSLDLQVRLNETERKNVERLTIAWRCSISDAIRTIIRRRATELGFIDKDSDLFLVKGDDQ